MLRLAHPAISRVGALPLAVIQSTNDGYVKSAESRRLLGPDKPTRRLYEVQARNHSFRGGKDALMRSVDDAMRWIAALASGTDNFNVPLTRRSGDLH